MTSRNTAIRDRHRAQVRQGSPHCALCGEVPLHHGGTDTLDNKQAAHRACNRAKGARLDGGPVIRRSGSLIRPGGHPSRDEPPHFHS